MKIWVDIWYMSYYVHCGFVIYGLSCVGTHSFHNLFRVFIKEGCWILPNAFYAPTEISYGFVLHVLNVITFIDLCMLNYPWIPRENPTWLWWMIPLMCLWQYSVCKAFHWAFQGAKLHLSMNDPLYLMKPLPVGGTEHWTITDSQMWTLTWF